MTERNDTGVSSIGIRPEKATETLSQFIAHVLDQLSLSAWLPSWVLVLTLTFVFQLGAVLDSKVKPKGAGDAISLTFIGMTKISLGGLILLLAAVVALTMLTQAFAFDAIRILEGYWGTLRIIEWIAKHRCAKYKSGVESLRKRYDDLTVKAWTAARSEIQTLQSQAKDRHNDDADVLEWTGGMLDCLDAYLKGRTPPPEVTEDECDRALDIPWQQYAPSDLLRQQVNLDKRLRDFPNLPRILPTRLGNILRTYEDQTERESVETFILELYEYLPSPLRAQHNEQRNRLDLYCSMVFVILLSTVVTVFRLGPQHWLYAVVAVVAGIGSIWLAYRAAMASARVYGLILVNIAQRFQAQVTQAAVEQ
jgi:hypothetical protein